MRIGSPAGPGQIEVGKADIDGDAAPLLLFQPVGIGAGERAHQGALAVVNVAGGADDDGLHANSVPNLLWNSCAGERVNRIKELVCAKIVEGTCTGSRVYYGCAIPREVLHFRRVEGRLSG